ncbi:MAG TPA: FAD-dependent oxidoreductase [Syntrophomonadaceae bacterium]|nr:FAD-dependent oxidoreductase [Syntrophomonadaceae bacterium]HPR93364.1 FAD-dependent oxidoreductase [Syntrophomonadaceae bacterium]
MNEENVKKGISRRAFIQGTAISAAGIAAAGYLTGCSPKQEETSETNTETGGEKWSWETKPDPIPAAEIKKTVDTEVLVIGAGLAGTVAAISAAEAGAKVIIIDKNDTTAARGGHITAFGTKLQKEYNISIDYRQVIRRWVYWAQGRVKEDLLWLFAEKSGACFDWVRDMVEPKGLKVALWDGYFKGPDYTEYPVTHFYYKDGSNFIYQDGVIEGAGNAVLLEALEAVINEKGIEIDFKTPAVQIVRDGDGPVTGVIAGEAGNYTQYNASKGVIICTGDYASDQEMVERYDPFALQADSQIYFPNKCNTGDVHKQAMWIGGAMQKVEPHAAVIHLESGAQSYGFLHVNAEGNRYMNEDVNTQSKSCVKEFQPEGITFTIYDADGLSEVEQQINAGLGGGLFYGQTFQRMGTKFDMAAEQQVLDLHVEKGKVLKADTLEELADKMGVPKENFLKTVERYNEIVAQKDDVDFGKRAELLTPIVKPPFYAGKLISTILTMVGGLRTNTNLNVLDENDQPVENLFVAGSAAGDFFANDYPTICPGIGHGRCITFGRLAGLIAAGKSVDEVPSIEV